MVEIQHDLFEFYFTHLAVADPDAEIGQQPGKPCRHIFDRPDFVVDKKDLPAAAYFAHTGFLDQRVIP